LRIADVNVETGHACLDSQPTTINEQRLTITEMPKHKTNSAAKKRFVLTATGKIKRKHAFKNHILTKKSKDRKKRLVKFAIVNKTDEGNVKRLLGIGK
jgi:large subunit ribosomal protein L35